MHDLAQTPRKHRIAVAMIYGGGADEELVRCIESFAPHVDGLYINFNGGGGLPAIPESLIDQFRSFSIERFEWEDDFAKARNQSFAMVDKDEHDWILWLDHDDSLQGGEHIQEMLNELQPATQGVFLKYEYGFDAANGKPIVIQWRERFLRTDAAWNWDYPIHEVCHGQAGTQYARKYTVWIRHHRTQGAEDRATRDRNRRILVKAQKADPDQARYDFYLANEIYAEADHLAQHGHTEADEFLAAIEMYTRFIQRSGWDDDAYVANHRIAECYRALGEHNAAIDADLQGIKLFPTWPDSYLGIAQSFLESGENEKAEYWATLALDFAKPPETNQAIEPLNSTYMPLLIRGLARRDLKKFEGALEDLQKAREIHPNEVVDGEIMRLRMKQNEDNAEEVGIDERAQYFGRQPEKSIAFLTRPSFETWHPRIAAVGGAGGAETCVMELAVRFSRDGWRVAVFGTPGEHRGVDEHGIEWWESAEYSPTEEFTVIVSSRAPEVFDANLHCEQSYLWLHDVNVGDDMMVGPWGPRWQKATKVITLTDWHRDHITKLYGIPAEHQLVLPNGIDIDRFPDITHDQGKSYPRFVYSSSPDRGLDVVLSMWDQIRAEWPNAELHVYYGWEAIDKILAIQPNLLLKEFKRDVEVMLDRLGHEDGGIHWHGRVPQDQLAADLLGYDFWLYPTYFQETFCITALEMQMAGVIPVTSNVAALRETVAIAENRIDGYPNNFSFRKQYMERLKELVNAAPDTLDNARQIGSIFASQFTWDSAYEQWVEAITRGLIQKDSHAYSANAG